MHPLVHVNTETNMFIAALFVIIPNEKQSSGSSMVKCIDTL